VREQNRFARLFAIPSAVLPRDWSDHRAYMRDMVAGDRLAVSPHAREMAAFLFGDGRVPLGRVVASITAELLPPRLVREFELARRPAVARVALAAFGAMSRALPGALTALPAHRDARRRLVGKPPSRIAAWTERQLFGLARQTAGAPARGPSGSSSGRARSA
jgi:uncharacterized protein (DUF2236 family)